MQNQQKTIKSLQHTSPTMMIKSKPQKDIFDEIRSVHQSINHQNTIEDLQNDDIERRYPTKTPSLMTYEQATSSEHNPSSSERAQDQTVSTMNDMLAKDKYSKINSPNDQISILIDRDHVSSRLRSQIFESEVLNLLYDLDFSETLLETKDILASSSNCHLERLLLWECNTGSMGIKDLQLDKLLRVYPTTECFIGRREKNRSQDKELYREAKNNSLEKLREISSALVIQSLEPDKTRFQVLRNLDNEISQNTNWLLRGGLPETKSINFEYSDLLSKLEQYKEKILNESRDENGFNLYVEISTSSNAHNHQELKDDNAANRKENYGYLTFDTEPLDPFKDIRKHFLTSDKTATPQVLLLTGQAGGGKSLFCRHLQKDLLSAWSSSFIQETEDHILWFPIYIDCSLMKEFEADTVAKALKNELSLTEEEIKILQTSAACGVARPNLLLIFDGCDTAIQKLLEEFSIYELDCENYNITYIFGAEKFKSVKILLTCREETIKDIKRRELLFAPTQFEEQIQRCLNSQQFFLQRRIEPFSDEQITTYLIKCCFHGLLKTSEKQELQEDTSFTHISKLPSDLPPSSSSWVTVKNFEGMIDSLELREMARTPFMLKVIVDVLPSIAAESNIPKHQLVQARTLTDYHLTERFIDKAIQANDQLKLATSIKTESEEGANKSEKAEVREHLTSDIKQQLQSLALRWSGYSLNSSISTAMGSKVEHSVLELNFLVEWSKSLSSWKFYDTLVMEYLVAEQIKQELIHLTAAYLTKEKITIQESILLNQHLLKLRSPQNITIRILCVAVEDKRISTDLLYDLIDLSRQKQKNSHSKIQIIPEDHKTQKKQKEDSKLDIVETNYQQPNQTLIEEELKSDAKTESNSQSSFGTASANAITILNMTGYDFSYKDLSNICVKGANLSYGFFEKTNFANADLQRVIFTGAWLEDVSFERANLQGVYFGADSDLKIWEDSIEGIAYSRNGRYLAAETTKQTVLYENIGSRYTSFKKVKTFPGSFSTITACPFSIDNKQVLTLLKNQISIWDIESEEVQKKLDIDKKTILSISSDMEKIVFCENKNIQLYSFAKGSCTHLLTMSETEEAINRDASLNQSDFFVLKSKNSEFLIYSSETGRNLLKQRQQKAGSCKFSSNGKQIAFTSKAKRELIYVSGIVRGHIIKTLNNQDFKKLSNLNTLKFEGDLLLYARDSFICIANMLSAKSVTTIKTDMGLKDTMYSFHPECHMIAAVKNKNTVSFINLYRSGSPTAQKENMNTKGLSLEGVIANPSIGLSEENMMLFFRKGEYYPFNENMIRGIFPNSSFDTNNVLEIDLEAAKLTLLHVKIICACLHWSNLKTLNLASNNLGDEGGKIIGKNESWVSLEELTLKETKIGDKAAVVIGNNQTWKNLKRLDLSVNKIGDEGAISIAENDVWKNLTELDLFSNSIGTKGVLSIIANKAWVYLNSLELRDNLAKLDEKDLLQTIQDIPSIKLERLTLSRVRLDREILQLIKYSSSESVNEILFRGKKYDDSLIRIIARDQTWTELKKLDLSNNGVTDELGAEIGSNLSWINLEDINLSLNNLGPKTGNALSSNNTWKKLKALDLSSNKIGDEVVSLISKNESWTSLKDLDLSSNNISALGAAALSKNTSWMNLESLGLQKNKIEFEGALALSSNMSWTNLTTLNLQDNNISDRGVAALSKNVSWVNLTSLNVAYNNICADGATALSKNASWTNLTSLELQWNNICDEGVTALSNNVSWMNLASLNLDRNSISDIGVTALSKNASWTNLTSLDLSRNKILASGATGLSKNTSWTKFTSLSLQWNSIGAEGITALSKNASWTNFSSLDLKRNSIGTDGAAALSNSISWKNLTSLNLDIESYLCRSSNRT